MIVTCCFTLVKGNNEGKKTYDSLPHIVALTMLIEWMGGGFIGQSALFAFMCLGQVFASLFMNCFKEVFFLWIKVFSNVGCLISFL